MRIKNKLYRFYEILPGALVWSTLLGAVVLSVFAPVAAICFVIIFDLYWLFRVIYFVFYICLSWTRFRRSIKKDWLAELSKIKDKNWQEIYHLIFLPVSTEGEDVLRTTLKDLLAAAYPKDKFLIVLAGEERTQEKFLPMVENLKKDFAGAFGQFWVTAHPKDLPDEIPGKGSNLNYSGHEVKKKIDELKIPYDKIIVSAFDADTAVHPQYFAYLSYRFLTVRDPLRASYQPIALYNNNIWQSSAPVRVAALGTTFWLMTELSRPERLFTFSSHSMPWQALVDVDFWQKDIVSEDSRIFLQCFFKYNGDYRVEPLFMPVSMDAVSGNNYRKSLVNLYKQQRRWAWGIENLPFMLWTFRSNRLISWQKKLKYTWNQGEGMFSWATAPLLIFLLGRLPFWFNESNLSHSLLYQNTPLILQWLMQSAMLGLLLSVILTIFLLPPRPSQVPFYRKGFMLLQWIILPITLVIFGSIPAIDAQTRLMLGKYLEFNITEKKR
ncbi:MAG: glycosyltransferase family 2 protein [bacterium]|nr:glycosyltransferase family 2 protein [bacterium]